MQVDAQRYLELAEKAGTLASFDIEAIGLRGDYNSVLVVSIKPYGQKVRTFKVTKPGKDKELVAAASAELAKYDVWVGYYSKGFDIPMLNTRLLRWSLPPIPKRHHVDMYYTLKYNLLTARRSQGHLLAWLELPEEKMTVSASVWSEIIAEPDRHMPTMVKRCESDAVGLEALYKRTRHLILEVKR